MTKVIKNYLMKFINSLNFRTKLMFTYFTFIIIPLGLLTFISYGQISKTIEGLVLYSAKQNFEQTFSFIDYKLGKIIDTSDIISVDRNLTDILTKPLSGYGYSQQIRDAQDLSTLYLTPYQNDKDISRVRLYVRDDLIYSREHINLFGMSEIIDSGWYKLLVSRKEKILWCPGYYFKSESGSDTAVVSAARLIRDPDSYARIIGVFRLDMDEQDLRDIVKKANITEKGVAYLQNTEGAVITSSDYDAMNKFEVDPSFSIALSKKDNAWQETNINDSRLLVGSRKVQGTDWMLVSIIPYEEILSTGNTIRKQMLVLLFILATVAYIIAYYISGSHTKRIRQLIRKMRKAQKGDLQLITVSPSRDEIGELMENFNFMIQKIEVLIKEQYKSGQEIKSAELKALQAQINPHFLYNTLDLINWTAIKHKVPEISSLVQSLSKFYKLSLNKGRDIVPISDELEHVRLYVNIQNRRFENKIALHINVDKEVPEYFILKTILQPIVENSIMHGILEKEDKSGNINITGMLTANSIILKIHDDGVGMDKATIDDILNSAPDENHGYGVRNINNRLSLYYGKEYGLTFRSEPDMGTEVEIRIPAINELQEDEA